MFGRKIVPGNTRTVPALVADPDAWSLQAASLGLVTAPFSPAARGTHYGGTSYTGLAGYGVLRWAGAGNVPVQRFGGPIAPIAAPDSQRLGFGAGPGGQPGLPSTGDQTGGGWWLTAGGPGMGG